MELSLSNRWQGLLAGVNVAHSWGLSESQSEGQIEGQSARSSRLPSPVGLSTRPGWARCLQLGLDQLQQRGELSIPVWWAESRSQGILDELTTAPGDLLLATLPIPLFYCDRPDLITQCLQQVWQLCPVPSDLQDLTQIWSSAIALALRGQLQPHSPQRFFRDLILGLNPDHSSSALARLTQLYTQLQTSPNLTTGLAPLEASPWLEVAIACFAFLETPSDFALTLGRLKQLTGKARSLCLAGALSGAYNGVSGIPLPWQSIQPGSTLEIDPELHHQINHLLRIWSGQPLTETTPAAPWLPVFVPALPQPKPQP